MKKLFIVLLVALFVGLSIGYSQELVIGTTQNIQWNAVSVPQGTVSYEIGLKDSSDNVTILGETTELSYTFDVPSGDTYSVGVRTKLIIDTTTYYSEWNWSDVDGESTPNPFVLLQAVPAPKNLRR